MTSWDPLPLNRVDPVPGPVPRVTTPRIAPGGRRELGLIGWLFCKLVALVWGIPEFHLFTVLVQHRRMFWTWGPFSGLLLNFGRLPKHDTEVAILRVAHLRNCEYELQQHRRLALKRGVDADTQAKLFAWPTADGLSGRQQALLTGVDELMVDRNMTEQTWGALGEYLDRRQLIEFVTLVGQYDALAMTLDTLGVPLDYPD
jgi:AhpD family alkylhydroperoxidase